MCALRDDYEKSKRGVLLLPEDRRQRQGAWLLIASLGIFFFSSLLLYFVYVAMRLRVDVDEPMSFHLPRSFIASTMLLLGISYCLHLSAQAARFDRVSQLIGLTFASLVMGILFLLIQTEGYVSVGGRSAGIGIAKVERLFVYTFSRGRPCIACSRRSHRIGVGGREGDAQEV